MNSLAKLDQKFVWHPFTQMRDWLRHEPIVIVEGHGSRLRDARGREYLDANSSIWTNLHGHQHPAINAAINRQLKKISHSSALGFANEPASRLAEKLVHVANSSRWTAKSKTITPSRRPFLNKVFFSDDGSTALEVALKLAYEYTRRTRRAKNGKTKTIKPRFLSLTGAYHGDTIGAVSLGHIDIFHQAYGGMLFRTDQVMSPYCYRCPFNRAKPERDDARNYRRCHWECVGKVEQTCARQKKTGNPFAAFVFEPLMQGAAGMIPQPSGWLQKVSTIARHHGSLLIADEVMTGFGRTSPTNTSAPKNSTPALPSSLFASHHENVQPDFLCVAKGLTGGYLPMAATLTSQKVFDAFLGKYEDFKSFFHGHSFTGNQLGAAAALASLDLLQTPASIRARKRLEQHLRQELQSLWSLPHVGDIRQVGLVAGIELVKNWHTRQPFDLRQRIGIRVCEAMARRGVLTRPVGNVIVIMPPYCTTLAEASKIVNALKASITEVLT